MSISQADTLIDDMIANRVFHVVLTGGECMSNYGVLTHFMRRLSSSGISFSMNSNLTLATQEHMDELAGLGLPHLLTTLNSHDPYVNDQMASTRGAFAKIVRGIRFAIRSGIRVSVNMITTQLNKTQVYNTGVFLAGLGVTNLFTTRMVPCTSAGPDLERELQLNPDEQKRFVLDEAIRVKADTGINIGSLIQYPVCFLQDVVKYRDFVGRGCPAGRKMLCVHANGDTEACFHENCGYGNVFRDGIKTCWEQARMWRDNRLLPSICQTCAWLKWCEGGCRVYTNTLDGMDLLAQNNQTLPSPSIIEQDFLPLTDRTTFLSPERLRWREEVGFWLVSVRGAAVYEVSDEVARFLRTRQFDRRPFSLTEFPGSREELRRLIELWIVETTNQSTTEPVSTRSARVTNVKAD